MSDTSQAFGPHPGLVFDASGVPSDPVHGDVFRSRAGGWREAESVFVDGCRLRERWSRHERFCVLELGFGLGLNFLATLRAWRSDPARSRALHFVSVETHPLSQQDLRRALAGLVDIGPAVAAAGSNGASDSCATTRAAAALVEQWPLALSGLHRLSFDDGAVTLTLAFGEGQRIVPRLALAADAFFIDGIGLARDPATCPPGLVRALARHARPGALLATRSVAASLREALAGAGFDVMPVPGGDRGPPRTVAVWAPRWPRWPTPDEPPTLAAPRAIVIGAGLAGAAIAEGFARRGFAVDLLDANPRPGGQGSAQPLVAEHLHLSPDDNPLARLSRTALLLRAAREHGAAGLTSSATRGAGFADIRGRLAVDSSEAEGERQAAMLSRLAFPPAFVRRLARDEAADAAGIALPRGGLWLPLCAALAPVEAIREWLASAGEAIRFRGATSVARLEADPAGAGWIAFDASGHALAAAPVVILANAIDAAHLGAQASLSMRRVRGQTTWLRDPAVAPLRVVLGGDAYAAPSGAGDGRVLIGASFDDGDSLLPDPRDDLGNLRRLGRMLDRDPQTMRAGAASAAAGFRFALPDRLPAIGPLPDEAAAATAQAELRRNDRLPIPMAPGLYGAVGFGSRGLLWAALAAELLPAMVCGEPAPLERELIAAIAPARFLRRRLRAAPR